MRTFSSNWPCIPPIVIAVSLPITCAETCRTTSGITGLTLPGMIEEPFCSSGRKISPMPARGPEPISARSPAILVSDTAITFSAPESSTSASRLACASNGSRGGGDLLQAGLLLQARAHLLGEPRVGVQPRAGGGAPERDLPDVHERRLHALLAKRDLGGVAGELLAERDRHGVHQVRAAGLDDVLKAFRLARERALELLERGQQLVLGDVQRGQVDGRGEHVVGGLAHVDVVVGVHLLAGERGDHLVGVHVRRGARAGLEHVDRELRVVLARGDLARGACSIVAALVLQSSPSSPLTAAAAPFTRASQCMTGTGTVSPEIGKFSTALAVSPPHSCLSGMRASLCGLFKYGRAATGVGPGYPQNATSSRANPTGSS